MPGPQDTPVWYHPESTSFYYVKKSNILACAHQKLFGASDGSSSQENSEHSEDCKASLTFSGKDEVQHNHPCFRKEQVQRVCYDWAVDLLTCTVGNSSWLAVGVGYFTSLWPKGVLLGNSAERKSLIDSAMLISKKRNAADKKRYYARYSTESFLRFSSTVKKSTAFEHESRAGNIVSSSIYFMPQNCSFQYGQPFSGGN